jgi:membrane protein EpsK
VWRKLTPQLRLNLALVKSQKIRELLGFSGWILVNQVGSLLFLNIDLIMTNILFGAVTAGRYGAVIVFPLTLRSLAATLNGVLAPIIFGIFAQNKLDLLADFSRRAVKYMGLFLALPIGLLCGLAEPLLEAWLGTEFSDLNWLVILLAGHLAINLAVYPLFSVQVATHHVRLPAIVTLLMGIANTVLALTLATLTDWGYLSIAVAGAIILTSKNTIFTPLYVARILQLPWYTFYPSLLAAVVGFLFAGIISFALVEYWELSGWIQLTLAAIATSAIYTIAALLFGINSDDRKLLWSTIRRA